MMENNANSQKLDKIISGTTTVGMIVEKGVVIGTESQATAGYMVATKQAQKLFEINKYACATISGGVADCQYVVNQIQALSRLKEIEEALVPDVSYIANVTRNILFQGRSYFLSMMIVGGYSLKKEKGVLYGIDLLGTLFKEKNFISFGSGSPFSLGVLEADWRSGMAKAEGIDLIKTAISASRERDAASGYHIQICSIDKDGFKQIQ